MKKLKNPWTFAIGLLIGALMGLIFWYWHKSTSAEDGALDLLDKMALVDAKIRNLEGQLADEPVENYITLEPTEDNLPPFLAAQPIPTGAEDLQQVKGIGPVFAQKLQAVDIDTLAALTAVTAAQLAKILDISEGRASAILIEAQRLQ